MNKYMSFGTKKTEKTGYRAPESTIKHSLKVVTLVKINIRISNTIPEGKKARSNGFNHGAS